MKVSEVVPGFIAADFSFRLLKLCRLTTNYFTLQAATTDTDDDCFNINSICTIKEGAANIINAISAKMFSAASTNYNAQAISIKYTILDSQMELTISSKIQRTIRISIIRRDD